MSQALQEQRLVPSQPISRQATLMSKDLQIDGVLEIPRNRSGFLRATCISAGIATVGLLAFYRVDGVLVGPFLIVLKVILGIAVGISMVACLYLVRAMVAKRPALVIDDKGIDDSSSFISPGYIEWSEVMAAEIRDYGNSGPLISVTVRNADAVIAGSRSAIRRWAMRFNRNRGFGVIVISTRTVKCAPDDLLAEINRRLKTARHRTKKS